MGTMNDLPREMQLNYASFYEDRFLFQSKAYIGQIVMLMLLCLAAEKHFDEEEILEELPGSLRIQARPELGCFFQ